MLLNEAQNINVVALYPVADAAGGAGDHRRPRLQLLRRRAARRGGSLPLGWRCAGRPGSPCPSPVLKRGRLRR
ncbi:MAG: hypothetical protein MZW92_32435 [Comamonadaceae bacterium]|nr:hypothetical protein [Comamonadaceae bacterium]